MNTYHALPSVQGWPYSRPPRRPHNTGRER
mgnify:CR=1 FL=1